MLSKRDLQARVRRLEQLLGGLNSELVRMAMEREPMLHCEVRAYLEALQEMATQRQGRRRCPTDGGGADRAGGRASSWGGVMGTSVREATVDAG